MRLQETSPYAGYHCCCRHSALLSHMLGGMPVQNSYIHELEYC